MNCFIDSIPIDILKILFLSLNRKDYHSFANCFYVCKKWNQIIRLLISQNTDKINDICLISVRNKYYTLLYWLINNYKKDIEKTQLCKEIVKQEDIQMLQLLYDKKIRPSTQSFNIGIKKGNLELIKWLKNKGCSPNKDTYRIAAKYKYIEILKWLKEINCPCNNKWLLVASLKSDDISIVEWVIDNYFISEKIEIINIIEFTSLKVLKWLYKNKPDCMKKMHSHLFYSAITKDDIDMLNWLKENNCPYDEVDIQNLNNISVRRWFIENGYG